MLLIITITINSRSRAEAPQQNTYKPQNVHQRLRVLSDYYYYSVLLLVQFVCVSPSHSVTRLVPTIPVKSASWLVFSLLVS